MIPMEPGNTARPGGQPPTVSPAPRRLEGPGPAGRGPVRSPAGTPADEVLLSPRAEEFRRIRSTLADLPAPSSRRIEELRALIERGAYPVDGERVAAAMLDDRATARLLGFGDRR